MTLCPAGGHDFPEENASLARCDEHGITLLWRGEPAEDSDFPSAPAPLTPCAPCLAATVLGTEHHCVGVTALHSLGSGMILSSPPPCPCRCAR
ncbi:hypothetical protein [Streptomyces corynorhini]|uniref:Uncharacterized protein n=1 Tax=Streptomyces corynorhini TaxID=2282652 RepID=A0A370B663_9ACTN|nr:hypothetical protein [Streptomyces corynorhini]RDG37290.1 hypothetical protein DVH02_15290 [Streptomyces corynorhini]